MSQLIKITTHDKLNNKLCSKEIEIDNSKDYEIWFGSNLIYSERMNSYKVIAERLIEELCKYGVDFKFCEEDDTPGEHIIFSYGDKECTFLVGPNDIDEKTVMRGDEYFKIHFNYFRKELGLI